MRNRAFGIFILIGLLAFFLYACDGGKNASKSSARQNSLLNTYLALEDSVQNQWSVMIADDDDKYTLMKRLLLEVSYTNNYDKARFKELNELVDQLKSIRYDQKSMSNSALIDAYDSATFDLSDQIILFARNHPRYDDFPLMSELIDDINGKNNYILMHRIHYDNWAKELNSFKKKHRKKLMTANPEIEAESMPLFELPS